MYRSVSALLLAALVSTTALAEDQPKGQALYEKHCTSCHNESVMTRSNRMVKDLKQLHGQVQRCERSLGLTWFEEDIEQVTNYLNKHFYKF